jgi:AcrR family transcriptional regulator
MTATDAAPAALAGGYAKGRARRKAILRTASQQFAERGFLSATILEIAAACGISRAGLLHYFPDKEALLAAVLEQRDDEDRRRFAPYVEAAGALGVLRGMVDLAEHNRAVPGLIELFVRLSAEASAPDHPAREYFDRRYERIRRGTERALTAGIHAGDVRADLDASTASIRLTALMDGLQLQWLLDPGIDMALHVRATLDEWLTPTGRARLAAIPPFEGEPATTPDGVQ